MKKDDVKKMFATTTIASVADVQSTLNAIVSKMFGLILVLGVLVIIWSAFSFLTSGGDQEKVETAKKILLYAVIAVAISILAGSIPTVLGTIF